jgi:hypothetical protein
MAAAQPLAAPTDVTYEFAEPIPGAVRTQSGGIAISFAPVAYPVSYYQVDVQPLNYTFTFPSMRVAKRAGFIAVRAPPH